MLFICILRSLYCICGLTIFGGLSIQYMDAVNETTEEVGKDEHMFR